MNHQFTERLGAWLREKPDSRDYAAGCKMFLQLTARVNMYKNLLAAPDMPRLETELQKHYNFRVAELTHAQVEAMDEKVESIMSRVERETADDSLNSRPSTLDFKRGKRADHDTLPPEIQALYVENLSVLRRMREVHLRLRNLSLETATCPDSERYPFLKELIDLDKKYRSNWQGYDQYRPDTAAT